MSHSPAELEPKSLWSVFASMAEVPRPSKHEERILAWARKIADDHGWKVDSDDVGNLVIRVPATPGREKAPTVILQGHLDMVCEKNNDVDHDFMNDPIRLRIDGEWVYATGTTLGADNGIGVAAALAAASDPTLEHGPLELLLTVDEETGLTGAMGLDATLLEGRILINTDSEEDGKLFVGCAGGADCHLYVEPKRQAPSPGTEPVTLNLRGLRGGHSGMNIHENRGNALRLVQRVLHAAMQSGIALELENFQGGSKHNAIPREAVARVHLPGGSRDKFQGVVDCMLEAFTTELRGVDEGLRIDVEEGTPAERVLPTTETTRLLNLIASLPHGVLGMSSDVPGLVETSSNLAVVEAVGSKLRIITSSRSSVNSLITATLGSIRAAGELAQATVETHDGYPGWKPNMDSPVLAVTRKVFAHLWGGEPEVTAIHAGLECGLLGEQVPGIDMISFGPQIEGAHSPDERVHIASVARFWNALRDVLNELAS